jgi:hypothetical protein
MHPPQIFLSACAFMLVAALATALLRFRGERIQGATATGLALRSKIFR